MLINIFFLLALLSLVLEDKIKHYTQGFGKTGSLAIATIVLPVLLYFEKPEVFHAVNGIPSEFDILQIPMFQMIMFLMIAMWHVEHMKRQGGINFLATKILQSSKSERQAFSLTFWATFSISPFIDNVLAAVMGLVIAEAIFKGRLKLVEIAVSLIIAANAGGAFLPTGDPPVLLAWLAKLLSIEDMLKLMFVPSLLFALPTWYITKNRLSVEPIEAKDDMKVYPHSGKMLFFGVFTLTNLLQTGKESVIKRYGKDCSKEKTTNQVI